MINNIKEIYQKSANIKAITNSLNNKSEKKLFLKGLITSAAPLVFAALKNNINNNILFIMQDADEAGYFYNDLTKLLTEENVLYFPSGYKRAAKYAQKDAANQILRTGTLAKINTQKNIFIVTSPEAIAELVVSKKNLTEKTLTINIGQTIDLTLIAKTLRQWGMKETDYVYEPGQFAIRGSIIDIFSFSTEYPFRIDLFGDEVDSIRTFNVENQLSLERKKQIEIVPELADICQEKVSLLSFLPQNTIIVMKGEKYICDIIKNIYNEGFSKQAIKEKIEGKTEYQQRDILNKMTKDIHLVSENTFKTQLQTFKHIIIGQEEPKDTHTTINFNITPQPLFHKNFQLLAETLQNYKLKGYKLHILADSKKQIERLQEILNSTQYNTTTTQTNNTTTYNTKPYNNIKIIGEGDATLHEGFIDNNLKICCLTDHQIFDRFHKYNLKSDYARNGKIALTMKELQEMQPGDYIVHVDFGIGQFGGLMKVPTDNSYQEVIRIIYQHNDKVDVSIHSLYKISKYKRADTTEPPRLSTLGTGAWERLKEKTKKKIKDIARDLIKLYAKRRQEKGFAFSKDSYLQHELEASFIYEDTPDQLKATTEVKTDMQKPQPMDRLVCGDVGFGKTEVAIRAAFKAATDSKQVAVMVPTTVLAFQHFKTFTQRLKDMPVKVEYLSRARSNKQTKEILKNLKEGKIDIIIGTHKLISKQVEWHDLGLLIIDEEQKFGVAVKEKLRKLKTNVDTLTMSATPIPRTLQFSLMGARDMSIIRTPPPNRYPIHTEITTYNHEIIAEAINFEMSRNGQVYFVSNRISSITEIANLIKKYVPDCRIAIGHGQMKPEELEKILIDFMNHDYDVLISTSIIENGIDVANANTIIINNAHKVGLSDLHQMRGRVGRSNRKAFCYLIAPPKSVLTTEARRRLEALENFSGLGSGFNIAMQDLDIRGAGNLLGAEQSGFMEDLGYETYQKILSQAVTELKNDEFAQLYEESIKKGEDISGNNFVEDCAIDSDLEMFFPEQYVPGSSERMALYRELDKIEETNELNKFKQRLKDRFGEIPKEGEELMQVVLLRQIGKKLGCEKIILKHARMTLQFVSNPNSAYYKSKTFGKILHFIGNNTKTCDLKEVTGRRLLHIANINSVKQAVETLSNIDNMCF